MIRLFLADRTAALFWRDYPTPTRPLMRLLSAARADQDEAIRRTA